MTSPDDKPRSLDVLVEQVAVLLDATVRAESGLFHFSIPTSPEDDEADASGDAEGGEGANDAKDFGEAGPPATVTLSASDDGQTLFATRHLTSYDDTLDLELLLRDAGETIHVQLAIDEDGDLVASFAAPMSAPAEWIADGLQELADFAPGLADEEYPEDEDDDADDADDEENPLAEQGDDDEADEDERSR